MRDLEETSAICLLLLLWNYHGAVVCLQNEGGNQDSVGEYCMWETFNATCPSLDSVVLMTTARYGRMKFGRCVREDHGSLGCHSQVLDVLDLLCSGRKSCAISIPDAKLHYNHPCPQELMPYLEASYVCVKVPSPERCSPFAGKDERFIIRASSSSSSSSSQTSSSSILESSSSTSSSGMRNVDASHERHRSMVSTSSSSSSFSSSPSGYLLSSQSEDTGLGSPSCPVVFVLERGQKVNLTLFNFPSADCDWTVEVEEAAPSHESTNENQGNRVDGRNHLGSGDDERVVDSIRLTRENETGLLGIPSASNVLRLSGCDATQRGSHVFTSRGHGPVKVKFRSSGVNSVGEEPAADGVRPRRSVVMVKYKVFGCADLKVASEATVRRHDNTAVVTCLGSGQNHVLTCVDGHWLGDQSVNCSKDGSYSEAGKLENKTSSVPIGLLFVIGAGVLIGVLMGILMLLMIVLFYRRSKIRYMRSQTTDPLISHQFQHHHHQHLLYHQQQQQHLLHHHHQQQQQHHRHHQHQRDASLEQSETSIYTISSHPQQRQCLLDSNHSPSLVDDDHHHHHQQQLQKQQQQQQNKSFSDQTLASLISPASGEMEAQVAQTLPPCYTRLQANQVHDPTRTLRGDSDGKRKSSRGSVLNETEYGPFGSSCFCVQDAKRNGVYIALEDASRSAGAGLSPQTEESARSNNLGSCASTLEVSRCSGNKLFESTQWEPSYLSKIDLLETNPQCCNQSNFF